MNYIKTFLTVIAVAALLVTSLIDAAGAGNENITILSPVSGANVTNSFTFTVYVTNPNVQAVQGFFQGSWIALTQPDPNDATTWTKRIDTTNTQEDTYYIAARYNAGGAWNNTPTSTITIRHPVQPTPTPTPTQYGNVTFIVTDYAGGYIQDVTVQPSGNKTDKNGAVIVAGLPLSDINFTFIKSQYNTTNTVLSFAYNKTQTQTITMRKPGDDLRVFKVTGYDEAMEAGRMIYLRVYDSVSNAPIDGAIITLFDGNVVQTIPGQTTLGRISVSFPKSGYYELTVEKTGFQMWAQDITILASKVTTPAPTPTPAPTTAAPTAAPTPDRIFRADANMTLTNDEYRDWMALQEEKRRLANLANSTAPTEIEKPGKTPIATYAALTAVFAVAGISIYKKKRDEKTQPQTYNLDTDILDHIPIASQPTPTPAPTTAAPIAAPAVTPTKAPENVSSEQVKEPVQQVQSVQPTQPAQPVQPAQPAPKPITVRKAAAPAGQGEQPEIRLTCFNCDWDYRVPADTSSEVQEALIKAHTREHEV